MTFLQPLALLLLLPVAAGAVFAARLRPAPGVIARAVMLSLLAVGLARPTLRLPAAPRTVIFAVDRSDSIPEAEQQRALAEASERAAALGGEVRSLTLPFGGDGSHTDLGGVLEAALRQIPADHRGEVVVFTDGRGNVTGPEAALVEAAARGVSVSAVPLDPSGPAGPGQVRADRDAAPGETVEVTVLLHGGPEGHAGPLTIRIGDEVLTEEVVTLSAGAREERVVAVPLPAELDSGLVALQAELAGIAVTGHVLVRRPPAVLLLGDRRGDTGPLAALLAAEGMSVTLQRPQDATGELDGYDVVVLADTPIAPAAAGGGLLAGALVAGLDGFVRSGGGLLVLGGERSYDLGGWDDTPLEALLPVRIDPDGAVKDDAVTLVIALDKSGSMARPAVPVEYATGLGRSVSAQISGGRPVGSKIRLADEGAIAALALLREKDRLGVLTIDSVARWAVPVQLLSGRASIEERILRIGAGGGGINLMTALEAAYEALDGADTPIRHVVLFADSAGISERRRGTLTALDLVGRYREADITLSIVGIGGPNSRDAEYLQELADRGGGRMYLTDDARQLPALFTQETERLMGAGLEEEVAVRARLAQWHPALADIDFAEAPPLRGINPVLRRERARVLLSTGDGDPLLAVWRVGLGEVAAAASDAGARWAARWLRWPGHAKLWTQLTRHLAAPEQSSDAVLTIDALGPRATARLTARGPDGLSADIDGLRLRLTGPDGEPVDLDRTVPEPGVWEASWQSPPSALWSVTAEDRAGERLAEARWAAPPSPEHTWQQPDAETLAALDQPAAATAAARRALDLTGWLLGLFVLLLPVDALARSVRRQSRGR